MQTVGSVIDNYRSTAICHVIKCTFEISRCLNFAKISSPFFVKQAIFLLRSKERAPIALLITADEAQERLLSRIGREKARDSAARKGAGPEVGHSHVSGLA